MTNDEKIKIYEDSIQALKNAVEIQCRDGNWNYDPYMHGMANGLIFALSLFEENKEGGPEYLEAPKEWLYKHKKEILGFGKEEND